MLFGGRSCANCLYLTPCRSIEIKKLLPFTYFCSKSGDIKDLADGTDCDEWELDSCTDEEKEIAN